ncbi:MAG: undecaprenyl/decaprenyl-phosphate alpha-N-acetylglucosaminyl 1-phosphate transferase [Candidatus Kerfeldbacteria bacterium]|nr:undecaprenyl/decaprenyl-phosphate alpha-N-acetylglucosaminyl 1-phosphate transferase [Candidatus Kerfeldbacteria bacterium]
MSLLTLISVMVVPILSVLVTVRVRKIAQQVQVLDIPTEESKKIHRTPTPLAGGVAVIIAWLCGVLLVWPEITNGYVLPKHLVGIMIASLVIVVGGVWDDVKNLKPHMQILAPLTAIIIVIMSGIGVSTLTNPFGAPISLEGYRVVFFSIHGIPYGISLFADLFTLVWLLGMMYTTKLLDGIDGLVSSMAIVGALFLALLSFTTRVNQPETGILALMLAGAFAGFLIFNWHPASIFLGESGSLFAGFSLGVLSIFSGAKIATTLLIFALPILDVMWVIGRRLFVEKRSPFSGDRLHLHQRLLDAGFSQRQTVVFLLSLTVAFGSCGLLFETKQKLIALTVAGLCMIMLGIALSWKRKQPVD